MTKRLISFFLTFILFAAIPLSARYKYNPYTRKLDYYEPASAADLGDVGDVTLVGLAAGDILYYSGAAWVNLGIGGAAQVLTVAAGLPSWQAAGAPAAHAASHLAAGADPVDHDQLLNYLAAEHLTLPNTIANVLTDHNLAAHTPAIGGTGQNSAGWTGYPYVTAGAWGQDTFITQVAGDLVFSPTDDVLVGTRITFGGQVNDDGIVFGALGIANRAIDTSAAGLAGAADYWIYNSASNYWRADGIFQTGSAVRCSQLDTNVLEAPTSIDLRTAGAAPGNISVRLRNIAFNALLVGHGATGNIGSLVNCTSNATATITKVAHGLALAAGDLIHITDVTTAADEGYYRLVSFTVNTLVVDRALSGSDADLDLTAYKDCIGLFFTDATNGQRIMNYSHQDKPLQIGGDTLQTTSGLGSEDVALGGITGYVREGAVYNWTYQASVADDGTVTLPAFTNGCHGFVIAGLNEERTEFWVDDDGDVVLSDNSANVVANADTDTNLCIGTAATQEPLLIKNRLGAAKNLIIVIWYD